MREKLLLLLIIISVFFSCTKDGNLTVQLESIKFESDSTFLSAGDLRKIGITFSPANYNNVTINWFSSDTSIVSISNTGVFKAKKPGEVTIQVSTSDLKFVITAKLFVIPPIPLVNPVQLTGKATDIGVGGNGNIYITGTDNVSASGGFSIKKWMGADWSVIPECAAMRVAVGSDGKPWVVNKSNLIFRHDGGINWTQIPGLATDIAVGADGSVFIIGIDEVSATGGNSICKWTGSGWTTLTECAGTRIAVDAKGTPWVVNKSQLIFKYNGLGLPWKQMPGKATDIGIGANGSVFITSNETVSNTGGYSIKKWNGYTWNTLNGIAGVNISVAPNGTPYWVDKSNLIFKN